MNLCFTPYALTHYNPNIVQLITLTHNFPLPTRDTGQVYVIVPHADVECEAGLTPLDLEVSMYYLAVGVLKFFASQLKNEEEVR